MWPPRLSLHRFSSAAALSWLAVAKAAYGQTASSLAPSPPGPVSADVAAPPSPAAAPLVTPPAVKSDPGAAYPQQALDEGFGERVEVSLILNVGADGEVKKAVVDKPAGHGFDDAAVAAALHLQFEPARRDGVPVPARIRFTYKFAPPPAVLSGRVVTFPSERPIAGATVVVRDQGGNERIATSDADGAWRLENLAAGAYHVTVGAPGRKAHESDETLKPAEHASVVDRLASERTVAPPAPVPGEGDVEQVEVRGEKPPREVTKFTLSRSELERIPGTGGDALKSLQSLPGVARPPGFLGLLIVRGSAPADSQYFIDGTPVPIIYHFGGITSVVPTQAIDKIDFFPGNFSAQYGRAMGGIVDVGLLDPKSDRLHLTADLNLIDGRMLVQGPVFDTGWRFTLAGRRSYVDAWLGPVLSSLGNSVSVAPVYYDYQALLERNITSRSTIRFGLFGSDDRLALLLSNTSPDNPTLSGTVSTHSGFWRAQAVYKNRISDQTDVRFVAAVGEDFVDFGVGNIYFNLSSWPVSGRAEISQKVDPRLTMNVGLDMLYDPYTVSARLPPLPRPGQPPPGPFSGQQLLSDQSTSFLYEPAAYVEWEATPWRGGRIVPGIRLDYTKDTGSWDFDPRIVVRQDITRSPRTTIKGGVGIFSQPPQPQETNAVFGQPGLTSNRSYHYDVGVEHEFTSHLDASLEGFWKEFDHLVVQGLGNQGSGMAYGTELLIRYKADERFFGWLAYTLSRSVRRDAPGMPLRLFQYDETHILTALGSYKIGQGWELGARYRLISGYMETPEQYGYYDENVGTYQALQQYPAFNTRLPLFHSLDLRVDKTWKPSWGKIDLYLDVLNVYNNNNVDGVGYNYNSTRSSWVGDLPFLPSLGLRVDL